MNKKRWIAVAIAVGLFLFSVVTSISTSNHQQNTEHSIISMTPFADYLYGSSVLQEQIIEHGSSNKVVILTIDGTITSGDGNGLFSNTSYNHEFFMAQLDAVYNDPDVQAVLLVVNSPGGGVYESAEIKSSLDSIQQEKGIPVYVSMQNMAASGGYYVSAGADKIFAADETLTGSIGVIMSGLNYSQMMEKIGITDTTIKSGALKDMGSAVRPESEEDLQVLQSLVDNSYNRFVQVVADGRGMSEEETRKIADGRIYDGSQAKEVGLIDEIGYTEVALYSLLEEYDLLDATVVQYQQNSKQFVTDWLGLSISRFFGHRDSEVSALSNFIQGLETKQAPRMMYLYGGDFGE